MVIRSIWAQSRTGAIGADGGMLWDLPEDMAYFARTTSGAPVVMGRKTWLSFPDRFRPLPNRTNIVITRDLDFEAPGAQVVHSLPDALRVAAAESDVVWVIGGAEIYAQAMPLVDELWVTDVDMDAAGDAYAPRIGPEWTVSRADPGPAQWHTSRTGTRYRFVVYHRVSRP